MVVVRRHCKRQFVCTYFDVPVQAQGLINLFVGGESVSKQKRHSIDTSVQALEGCILVHFFSV